MSTDIGSISFIDEPDSSAIVWYDKKPSNHKNILELELNNENTDNDQETTGIVNKNLNNHSQASTHN